MVLKDADEIYMVICLFGRAQLMFLFKLFCVFTIDSDTSWGELIAQTMKWNVVMRRHGRAFRMSRRNDAAKLRVKRSSVRK